MSASSSASREKLPILSEHSGNQLWISVLINDQIIPQHRYLEMCWKFSRTTTKCFLCRYCKSRGALIVGITNTVSQAQLLKEDCTRRHTGGFHHLPRVPLRNPHQRWPRDRCRLDEGLHQPDALPHHVRPRHVRGQDQPPAKEVGDHPGSKAVAGYDQVESRRHSET